MIYLYIKMSGHADTSGIKVPVDGIKSYKNGFLSFIIYHFFVVSNSSRNSCRWIMEPFWETLPRSEIDKNNKNQ